MVDAVEHDKHNSALGQTVTPAEKSAEPMNEKCYTAITKIK